MQLKSGCPTAKMPGPGDSSYDVTRCQSMAQPVRKSAWTPPFMNRPTPSARSERSASAICARAEATPGLAHRVGATVSYDGNPHVGTHLANGGLVPLGQAAGAPARVSGPMGDSLPRPLLCTEPPRSEWFVLRWQLEYHLSGGASPGDGDPRQTSDLAIARIRQSLGLFSWTTTWQPMCGKCTASDVQAVADSWMPRLCGLPPGGWRRRVFHYRPPTLIYGNSPPSVPSYRFPCLRRLN